jgi:hypothetical protein
LAGTGEEYHASVRQGLFQPALDKSWVHNVSPIISGLRRLTVREETVN